MDNFFCDTQEEEGERKRERERELEEKNEAKHPSPHPPAPHFQILSFQQHRYTIEFDIVIIADWIDGREIDFGSIPRLIDRFNQLGD